MENKKEVTLQEMQEMVEDKAKQLSGELKKKVFPLLFLMDDEYIVGYYTEPTREQKAIAIGTFTKTSSVQSAGMQLLKWNLVQKESDVRFMSDDSKYDGLVFGAAEKVMYTIEILAEESKKK